MNSRTLLITYLFLTGCSAGGSGLQSLNPLAAPPWEAYVRAGPGAEFDLDEETLNGPATASVSATSPNPELALQQPEIENSVEESRPNQSKGEIIRAVSVLLVTGGDNSGNAELTAAMRNELTQTGWPVLEEARKDALAVEGKVNLSEPVAGQQTVSITWLVKTPSGKLLGDISQTNTIPTGSLDQSWGENAQLAAKAAAEGIVKLIQDAR